jgi:hypothetical protein
MVTNRMSLTMLSVQSTEEPEKGKEEKKNNDEKSKCRAPFFLPPP